MYFTGTSSPASLLLFLVTCAMDNSLSYYPCLCKEFILGVCDQEVFQQAFSLFLPKTFVKIETVLVSSADRLVAFRARVSLFVACSRRSDSGERCEVKAFR